MATNTIQNRKIVYQDMQSKLQETRLDNNAQILFRESKQDQDYPIDIRNASQPTFNHLTNGDPYVTSFVCLLVPRFEEHLLIGDLSDQIPQWMADICVSFGWKLKFMDVRSEYLHWIMTVSITTYPTQFMKIIRKATSAKIFEDFPRFKQKNMSKDFWAPWYFVGIGEVPYSQDHIQSFITQIRIEQGLQ